MNKLSQQQTLLSLRQLDSAYRKTVLENGIRIVTETIPTVRSASIGVWINAGARDENAGNSGIAHFLEHMVFKGTKNYSVKQISKSMESLGGYLNAFTTKEHTCFLARVLDEYIEDAIAVLADLALHPLFPEKELHKEKLVVLEELKSVEDDPEDWIFELLEKNLYPHQQLGVPIIGTEESVQNFSREKLKNFSAQFYIPSNIVIVAAGNIQHERITALAQKYFPLSAKNGQLRKRIPIKKRAQPVFDVIERPMMQAHICTGTTSLGIHHPLRYAMLVLHTLLGEGMSSRLFQNIREKYGFAYSVYSFLNFLSETSTFGAYIATDEKHIEKSLALIQKEFKKLIIKTIAKQELQQTKTQLKGTMMLSLESMSNRMMRLGGDELYFGEHTSLSTVSQRIDEVTVESVFEVAQKMFEEDNFSTVILKPVK